MPKVELNDALYLRLEAVATRTATIEVLVNRAVDEYLQIHFGGRKRGSSVQISPKQNG